MNTIHGMNEVMILLETPDFLIAAKPPGMETLSQDGGPELTALLRRTRNEPGLTPAHRLDRDTSGAQLLARTPEAEKGLVALFKQRRVHKSYLALCLGVPRNREGTINRNLSEWSGGRRPVRVLKKGGLEASTGYRVLAGAPAGPDGVRVSVISFQPHQGRTHQIRVHAAAFGYPILGDDQYGDRAANRTLGRVHGLQRQALHSWKLSFDWRGKTIQAVCPPPKDIRAAYSGLFGGASGDGETSAIFL